MITNLLLLDVRPEPVSTGVGAAGLIVIGVVVLMFSAAALVGFVFLLRWLLRSKPQNVQNAAQAAPKFQPSNPNQP
jgi:hypothetical protein